MPTITFSSSVISLKMRMFWKVRAMPPRVICVRLAADQARAVEADVAAGGRQQAGDEVEHGGLAGAVGADQAEDAALRAPRS